MNSMKEKKPGSLEENRTGSFDALFVDRAVAVDTERIISLLKPLLELTRNGDFFLLSTFHKMKNEPKMLALLLGQKVLAIEKIASGDSLAPIEIQKITGLGVGTVNPTLSGLKKRNLVRNDAGRYSIPDGLVSKILTELEKSSGGN